MAARRMTGLVLVLVILFFAVGGYSSAWAGAVRNSPDSPTTEIDNESVSVNAGELVTLAESNNDSRYYYEESRVNVYNNTTLVDPTGNYTWFKKNGTFRTDPDTEVLNDTTANVSYGYYLPSREQELARTLTLFPADRGELFGLALGAATLLAGLAYANGSRR